jgi:hypothetical protein
LRTTLRFLSLIFLVVGLVLMGADLITSMDRGGEPYLRSIAQVWAIFDPASIVTFKDWVGHEAPWASNGVEIALTLWGWGVLGGLGVILNFLSGRGPARAR